MRFVRFQSLALVMALATFSAGCELVVHLDRSAADGGDDAGCSICTNLDDAGDEDGTAADAPGDTPDGDTGIAVDAQPDGFVLDAASKGEDSRYRPATLVTGQTGDLGDG